MTRKPNLMGDPGKVPNKKMGPVNSQKETGAPNLGGGRKPTTLGKEPSGSGPGIGKPAGSPNLGTDGRKPTTMPGE